MSRSSTVVFKPRNRLAKIMDAPDGMDFAGHVTRAEQAVDHLAPLMANELDGQITALALLCQASEHEVFETCRDIGHAALTLVESARLAGRPDIAELAEGVWEMIEALSARGVWHTNALKVHATALSVLSSSEDPEVTSSTMAAELKRLRAAIGALRIS